MRSFVLCIAVGAVTPLGVLGASPAPSGTMPPEIEHTYTRPVCSALQTVVGPAIGMLKQNDQTIAKSPKFFKDYSAAQFNGSRAQQDISVLRLENLVSPLANNVLAIQKLLSNKEIFPVTPQTNDDRRKLQLKRQLEETLAQQQGALDIINGFVDTQQMGSLQHAGMGYISSIASSEVQSPGGHMPNGLANISNTPAPDIPQPFDNTIINAGLPTNPYEIDLTRIPGLALGYNPVNNLKKGIEYTQKEGKKKEAALAKTVIETVRYCHGSEPAAPSKP